MSIELPEGWSLGPLLNFFELKRGHDLPVQNREPGAIPVVASNGIVGWHASSPLVGPGVVTGRSGTIGKVNYISGPYWPLNTTLYVRDFKKSVPEYVYRFLEHFPLTDFQSGTGVPTLNRNDLHPIEVAFPPPEEQLRIVEVLRSGDDAIAATANVLQGLERVSSEITKRAFVDPDSVEVGGEVSTFEDLFDIKGGSQPPKSSFIYKPKEGYARLLQIRDFETDDKAVFISEGASKVRCEVGDILIARYGASVGRILTGKAGAYNVALTKVVFRSNRIFRRFAYHWLKSEYFQNRIKAVSNRSAQAGFNKEDLFPTKVSLPPMEVQVSIAKALDDLENAISINRAFLQDAEATKSALLTDLITGRVRVPA